MYEEKKASQKKQVVNISTILCVAVSCVRMEVLKYYYCVLYMCVAVLFGLLFFFSSLELCILFRVGYSYDYCQFSFVFAFRWFSTERVADEIGKKRVFL